MGDDRSIRKEWARSQIKLFSNEASSMVVSQTGQNSAEPDMTNFAARIREIRAANRMSLDDLAKASGFTKSHCWELEQGRAKNPTVRAVWGLAKALGTTPAYLLGINPNAPPVDPLATRIAAIISAELESRAPLNQPTGALADFAAPER